MSMLNVEPTVGVKPATGASKPMSTSDTQNHSTLSAKRENARRVEDHHRNLNKQNHWKPTGRHFTLYDEYLLTRIVEPIVEPLELIPCVSSNSKVTMISRFTDYKLSNPKAGSKGIFGIFEC
nr:hypothetical protein [Tanacetum cinerariifolium]